MKFLLIFSAFFTVLHAQNYTCEREKINVTDGYISENNLSEDDLIINNRGEMKLAYPQPRERLIDLVPLSSFDPPVISVKRCYGYCPSRLNYKPSKITKKQIIVKHRYRDAKDETQTEYISIDVEEHVECSPCICLIPEDDCVKDNKRLNSSICACV